MTVAVVTPWLNHLELQDDYFNAIANGSHAEAEIIILDNCSDEPLPFASLRFTENRGFSKASNVGLNHATADIVVFLNNDIAGGDRGWLDKLAAATTPGVLAGAQMRHDDHGDVDGQKHPYLDGWCIAGRRSDLLALGGFDEGYDEPAYYSDNEICFRARMEGMRLREVRTGLTHKGSLTTNGLDYYTYASAVAANYARFQALVRDVSYAA